MIKENSIKLEEVMNEMGYIADTLSIVADSMVSNMSSGEEFASTIFLMKKMLLNNAESINDLLKDEIA
ncbi:MAG: hypothetical protein K0Q97_1939 [Bacillota bacterium]|jgi:hypothetical protein|nr:hypothetical protein [Bacillota bacterium]